MLEPKKIKTAPEGGFLAYIPSTKLWWPCYRAAHNIYSNSHGILNQENYGRVLKATYWLPMPPAP